MGRKVLIFLHGWDTDCEKLLLGRFRYLFGIVYFRADGYIVLAEAFRKKLLRAGYRGPVVVGQCAVDDRIFDAEKRSTVKTDGPINVLMLTRIEPLKGIREGIQAFRILRQTNANVRLLIAGEGSESTRLHEECIEAPVADISFLGHVEGQAKESAFERADIFLFPSRYGEGMPANVVEAMAHGLPVVTRPVGGLADFFQNGLMGFATESTDPRVWAEFVQRLIAEPELRLAMGRYNRTYAQKHFAASQVANALQDIYASM